MLYVGRLCICTFMFIVLISCCALARRDMIARGVPLRDFIFLEEIEILDVLTVAHVYQQIMINLPWNKRQVQIILARPQIDMGMILTVFSKYLRIYKARIDSLVLKRKCL